MEYTFEGTVKGIERTTKERKDVEIDSGRVVIGNDNGVRITLSGDCEEDDFTKRFKYDQKVKVVLSTPQSKLDEVWQVAIDHIPKPLVEIKDVV